MSYHVNVTGLAKDDIWQNYRWWGENRSQEQAARWFLGIDAFILNLANTADQYSLATEPVLKERGIRQAAFGVGRRATHRIIFGIVDQVVIIYRVRAFKQDAIGVDKLSGDD